MLSYDLPGRKARLIAVPFHHQAFTAKPLFDAFRAILMEVIADPKYQADHSLTTAFHSQSTTREETASSSSVVITLVGGLPVCVVSQPATRPLRAKLIAADVMTLRTGLEFMPSYTEMEVDLTSAAQAQSSASSGRQKRRLDTEHSRIASFVAVRDRTALSSAHAIDIDPVIRSR
jgi:hypothetical protein